MKYTWAKAPDSTTNKILLLKMSREGLIDISLTGVFFLFVWGKRTLRSVLDEGKVRDKTEEGQRELQEKQIGIRMEG